MALEAVLDHKRARLTGVEEALPRKRARRIFCDPLPEELIFFELLTRLPVKSLIRFKSVCKSWHAFISTCDPHFTSLHLHRSKQQLRVLVMPVNRFYSGVLSCHFVQENSATRCESEFLPGITDMEAVAYTCQSTHCNGLILFNNRKKLELYVCNPATRELVTLPTSTNIDHPTRSAKYGHISTAEIGHDPLTNKYKVVRFFYRASDRQAKTFSLGVEVLTLGSHPLSWIPVEQDSPYPVIYPQHVSTAEGVIYWLIDNGLHNSSHQAIMSFDLRDGSYGVIPPPPTWTKTSIEFFHMEVVIYELDGDLCCSHCDDNIEYTCIYRRGRWHISHKENYERNEQLRWSSLSLATSNDGKFLRTLQTSFQYYDPRTHSRELIAGSTDRWLTVSQGGEPWYKVIRYTESMIPISRDRQPSGLWKN